MTWIESGIRHFFTVEEHFEIDGRGTVLLPGVTPEFDGIAKIGDRILIRTPAGREIETHIHGIELSTPNPDHIAPILLRDLRKADVPIGSEIFLRLKGGIHG